MRIAIITENFLPKLDGVTRTLARLLEYLQAHGHQALLLGPDSGMIEYAGAQIVGTAGVPLPFYPELKLNFFRPLFVHNLKAFRPDIVHLVDPVVLGTAGLAVARALHTPLVSSYHTNLAAYCAHFGFTRLAQLMWSYNRLIHNQCALTFCPSPSTASMLRAQDFEHIRLWPRGVDTALFRPERRDEARRATWLQDGERVVILYVGRVSWEKNVRLLIQAYQGMDHTRCHLVIVGDGPALNEVKHDLAGLPVTFTGYLQGEELASSYASADLFAFPSQTETFGQVVLEASAAGLPVVALQAEGVCDIVEHKHTGYLFAAQNHSPSSQVNGYRQLLTHLVEQHELRQTMGRAAQRMAQQRSWDEAMGRLLLGYAEVVEQAHSLVAA